MATVLSIRDVRIVRVTRQRDRTGSSAIDFGAACKALPDLHGTATELTQSLHALEPAASKASELTGLLADVTRTHDDQAAATLRTASLQLAVQTPDRAATTREAAHRIQIAAADLNAATHPGRRPVHVRATNHS